MSRPRWTASARLDVNARGRRPPDLPGTKAFLVRSYYHVTWVALFNTGVQADVSSQLYVALWDALGKVTAFPNHDLFSDSPEA